MVLVQSLVGGFSWDGDWSYKRCGVIYELDRRYEKNKVKQ